MRHGDIGDRDVADGWVDVQLKAALPIALFRPAPLMLGEEQRRDLAHRAQLGGGFLRAGTNAVVDRINPGRQIGAAQTAHAHRSRDAVALIAKQPVARAGLAHRQPEPAAIGVFLAGRVGIDVEGGGEAIPRAYFWPPFWGAIVLRQCETACDRRAFPGAPSPHWGRRKNGKDAPASQTTGAAERWLNGRKVMECGCGKLSSPPWRGRVASEASGVG